MDVITPTPNRSGMASRMGFCLWGLSNRTNRFCLHRSQSVKNRLRRGPALIPFVVFVCFDCRVVCGDERVDGGLSAASGAAGGGGSGA